MGLGQEHEKSRPDITVFTFICGHFKCLSDRRAAGGSVCELHSGVCYQANVLIS